MPSAAAPAPNAVSSGLINNPTTRHGASAMSTTRSNLPSAFVVASDKPRDNGKGLPSTSTCHSTPTDFSPSQATLSTMSCRSKGRFNFFETKAGCHSSAPEKAALPLQIVDSPSKRSS